MIRVIATTLILCSLVVILIGCGEQTASTAVQQSGVSTLDPTLPPPPLTAVVVLTGEAPTELPPSEPTILAAQYMAMTQTAVRPSPTPVPPTATHTNTPVILPSPTNTSTPTALGQQVLLVKAASWRVHNPPRDVDRESPGGLHPQQTVAELWPTEPGAITIRPPCDFMASTILTTAITMDNMAGGYNVTLAAHWEWTGTPPLFASHAASHAWYFHVDSDQNVVFTGQEGVEPPFCLFSFSPTNTL